MLAGIAEALLAATFCSGVAEAGAMVFTAADSVGAAAICIMAGASAWAANAVAATEPAKRSVANNEEQRGR
jgi:hypothetical protein